MARRSVILPILWILFGGRSCHADSNVRADPHFSLLEDYGLTQNSDGKSTQEGTVDFTDYDSGEKVFTKDDIYYHDYYTDIVKSWEGTPCTKRDFICPQYKGTYGHCLRRNSTDHMFQVCDGTYDCLNGADESRCYDIGKGNFKAVLWEGQTSNMRCGNGKYAPDIWKCDGYCDCPGACEDEVGCPTYNARPTPKTLCQQSDLTCDGWLDCLDGSDEKNCMGQIKKFDNRYKMKNEQGSPNRKLQIWAKCADNNVTQQWYHRNFRCDGRRDCTDGSDETGCARSWSKRITKCQVEYGGLMCKAGQDQPLICLKETNICSLHMKNREIKCYDSALKTKNSITSLDQILAPVREHSLCTSNDTLVCKSDEFKCRRQSKTGGDDPYMCISGQQICNGNQDCYLPKLANQTSSMSFDTLLTSLGQSKEQLKQLRIQNGYFDDEDSTRCQMHNNRETNCNCPTANGCLKTAVFSVVKDENGAVRCGECRCVQCNPGFRVTKSKGCVDKDECQKNRKGEQHHPCSHGCTNTVGSFYCHCPAGLVLGLDGVTCRPVNADNYAINMYVSQQDQVIRLRAQIGKDAQWEFIEQETIHSQKPLVFTALALDENEGYYTKDVSGKAGANGKLYFGSYNSEKKDGKMGGTVFLYEQKYKRTSVFYRFKSGAIEGMSFDAISGILHVTLTKFKQQTECLHDANKVNLTGQHVMFPTYSNAYQNKPFFAHHVPLIKPRAVLAVPDHAATYIADWLGNDKRRSYIYKITFTDMHSGEFKVKKRFLPMVYPNAIVHDKFHHRLIIIDTWKQGSGRQNMISCDYDLEKCYGMMKHASYHLFSAAILGKNIWFTEMKTPEILQMNMFNPADVRVVRRFNKQTYGVIHQNYEEQTKTSTAQNPEICKDSKKCDYMCITHSLKGFAEMMKMQYNKTNFGIMGASCMCPDGSINNTVGATCDIDKSGVGAHKIRHAGFVLADEDRVVSLQAYDVGKGSQSKRYLQLNPSMKFFNTSGFLFAEFYNPIDKNVYKWDSERGMVHMLQVEALKCGQSMPIKELSASRVTYSSYGAIKQNGSSTYRSDWLVNYNSDIKLSLRKPHVIATLGIVCGYTYVSDRSSDNDYLVYCFPLSDFATEPSRAFPIHETNFPPRFAADEHTLVFLNRYKNTLEFYDWYNMNSGVSFHTTNITSLEKVYGSLQNVYHVNGINGEVFLTTKNEILNFDMYHANDKNLNGTAVELANIVLNMTEMVSKVPGLKNWCNKGDMWSWGFDSITVIDKRLYGVWSGDCQLKVPSGQSATGGYTYNGYTYVWKDKSLMFACDLVDRKTKLTGDSCKFMDIDPEHPMQSGTPQDPDKKVIKPHWHVFVDFEAPAAQPLDCVKLMNGTRCPYFCAVEPYPTAKAYCICPLGQTWNEDTKQCATESACYTTCKDAAGKQVCLSNFDICDGTKSCADGSDEWGCVQNSGECYHGTFSCDQDHAMNQTTHCVTFNKLCDGIADCKGKHHGADEAKEQHGGHALCGDTYESCKKDGLFFCATSNKTSIASSYDYKYGPTKTYYTTETGFCISWEFVADGTPDCTTKGYDETYWAARAKCDAYNGVFCTSTKNCVIDKTKLCNGINDCGIYESSYNGKTRAWADTSDEDVTRCKSEQWANLYTCNNETHYKCEGSGQCIDRRMLCNGHSDCYEGEDETKELCANVTTAAPTMYHHTSPDRYAALYSAEVCESQMYCAGAEHPHKQICVKSSQICDGVRDCKNNADEDGECKTACTALSSAEKALCGTCQPTPQGPECACGEDKPGLKTLIRGKKPRCEYKDFCKFTGTCDQQCVPLQELDEKTKMPYQCACKRYSYYPEGDKMQHCKSYSSWKIYTLDVHGQLDYKTIWMGQMNTTDYHKQPMNLNARKRKLNSQAHGWHATKISTFTVDQDEGAIYSVERAQDGYDVIYTMPTQGATNWDIMLTLPKIWIDSITPGFSHKDYTYLFVGARMPMSTSKVEYGIYALSLSGNAALIVAGLPAIKNGANIPLRQPVTILRYLTVRDALYFVQGPTGGRANELWRFNLESATSEQLYRFDGSITDVQVDDGADKLWLVLDNTRVVSVDYDCRRTPVELHLHPKLYNISGISVHEDKLLVNDYELASGYSIWNKFTGAELPEARQFRQSADEAAVYTPPSVMMLTGNTQRRSRRTGVTYLNTLYWNLDTAYFETRKNATEICPQNTFNLFEQSRLTNYSHCYCLGWRYDIAAKPVNKTTPDKYGTYLPCGEPSCQLDVLLRYPALRQAVTTNDDMTGIADLSTSAQDKVQKALGKPNGDVFSAQCFANFAAYNYSYVKYDDYYSRWKGDKDERLNATRNTVVDFTQKSLSYQCNRIGAYNAAPSTYHMHVDGAFVAGPHWHMNFPKEEKKQKQDFASSYSSSTYYKMKSMLHASYFGDAFYGKYCDYAGKYMGNVAPIFFESEEACKLNCTEYKCVEAVNNKEYAQYYSDAAEDNPAREPSSSVSLTQFAQFIWGTQQAPKKQFYCDCPDGLYGKKCGMQRKQVAVMQKSSGMSGGKVTLVIMLVLLCSTALCGLAYAGVDKLKSFTLNENPYSNNASKNFSYQDLDEDRDALFPDKKQALPDVQPSSSSSLQREKKQNTANVTNEFDFSGGPANDDCNLIDTDTCMGFNIPTQLPPASANNSWGAPPPFESPNNSATAPASTSQPTDSSSVKGNIVTNPFFGGGLLESKPRSDSKTALVDL